MAAEVTPNSGFEAVLGGNIALAAVSSAIICGVGSVLVVDRHPTLELDEVFLISWTTFFGLLAAFSILIRGVRTGAPVKLVKPAAAGFLLFGLVAGAVGTLVSLANLAFIYWPILSFGLLILILILATQYLSLKRMKFSEQGDAALRAIASQVGKKLHDHAIKHSEISTAWSFGYPKLNILFESQADLLAAQESPALDSIASFVATSVRTDPAFGRNREGYQERSALWLTENETTVGFRGEL